MQVSTGDEAFRIAVNVRSDDGSKVQFLVRSRFEHPITAGLAALDLPDRVVRIVAALVNDVGSPKHETVTLRNTWDTDVDLTGWALLDKTKYGSSWAEASLPVRPVRSRLMACSRPGPASG